MGVTVGSILFGCCALMALAPIRRPRSLAVAAWIIGAFPNELPLLFLLVLVVSNVPSVIGGDFSSPGTWISVTIAVLTVAALVVLLRRALATGGSMRAALDCGLSPTWRSTIDPQVARRLPRHLPWLKIVLLPWPLRPRSVERVADVPYGDGGTSNLADIYRHWSRPTRSPILVHLHGGRFRWGRKSRESRALLFRLASNGWTCISANYHLSATPAEGFPRHLLDVKRLIAWIRVHGHEYGGDPTILVLSGSSAGAHLTAMAALTANNPRFQPGFEDIDTSITAGIGFGGYYGALGAEAPSSDPLAHAGPQCPPLLVVHGDHDTYTPLAGACRFVVGLRASGCEQVVFAPLPGGRHSFDLFQSIRFSAVVDEVEQFTAWLRSPTTHDAASARPPARAGRSG